MNNTYHQTIKNIFFSLPPPHSITQPLILITLNKRNIPYIFLCFNVIHRPLLLHIWYMYLPDVKKTEFSNAFDEHPPFKKTFKIGCNL